MQHADDEMDIVYFNFTWIIGSESNGGPSTGGNSNGIPLNRINEVEVGRISLSVEIPQSPSNDKEIESMEMDGVGLRGYKSSVLEHNLHCWVVSKPVKPRPIHGLEVGRRAARVVKGYGGVAGEVVGEDAAYVEIVGLKERRGGHDEADIVDICHHPAAIGASGAWIDSEADREEKGVIHCLWDIGGVLVGVEAAKSRGEVGGNWGGVEGRWGGERGGSCGEAAGVVQDSGGGGIVNSNGRVHERRDGD